MTESLQNQNNFLNIEKSKARIIAQDKDLYLVQFFHNQSSVWCIAKGKFRNQGCQPLVGDIVCVVSDHGTNVISEVEKRKNQLLRPPVANVDQVLIVQSIKSPKINTYALDKLLVVIEKREIPILICFSKLDLISDDERREWFRKYSNTGYPIIFTGCDLKNCNVEIEKKLQGKITAIAGQSGVGKSTLIQRLTGDRRALSGTLSKKNERGKQTTRRIQLFEINQNSFIFDTPGFSTLDLRDFSSAEELNDVFPEIRRFNRSCRFRNCTHRKEPDCAVRKAVDTGEISTNRYESYLKMYDEIESKRR